MIATDAQYITRREGHSRSGNARVEWLEPRRLLNGQPVGSEIAVNTFTPGTQNFPDVAADAAGNFVVVWSSLQAKARLFDSGGVARGPEFLLSAVGTSGISHIAMHDDGRFVVTWTDLREGSADVYIRRFDPNGQALGPEYRANDYTPGGQRNPDVSIGANGQFVVTWADDARDGNLQGVYARRFDSNGEPIGTDFQVNTYTLLNQGDPKVAIDAAGKFVITWLSGRQDGTNNNGVYAQRYDAQGSPLGQEFRVNPLFVDASEPQVASAPDGGFYIAWEHGNASFRRYDASGVPVGSEVVPGVWAGGTRPLAMDVDNAGNVVIIGEGDAAQHPGIFQRRYDSAGNAAYVAAGRVNVNTITTKSMPAVAMDGAGDYVIAWVSTGQDGSEAGIFARRVRAAQLHVEGAAFTNFPLPHRVRIEFSSDVSASLSAADLLLRNTTTGQTVPTDQLAISYDLSTNAATLSYIAGGGIVPEGKYLLTVQSAGITDAGGVPLVADFTLAFNFFLGDANGDGLVNLLDFNILVSNFGQSPRTFDQGDFDFDGDVDLADFNILASRFGQGLAPDGSLPGASGIFARPRPFGDSVIGRKRDLENAVSGLPA